MNIDKILDYFDKIFEYGLVNTIILAIVIFIIGYVINRYTTKLLVKKNQNSDFIIKLKKVLIYSFVIYACISMVIPLQKVTNTLLASGGLLVLCLGLAAQEAVANIVGGLFILMFKPFKIGDLIAIPESNLKGTVVDISIRHTSIQTIANTIIEIPNAICNQAIIENLSNTKGGKGTQLVVGISYDSDIEKAMQIIKELVINHPSFIDIRSKKEKKDNVDILTVRVSEFSDSSIILKTVFNTVDNNEGLNMLSDVYISIKKEFDKNKITIPYNHHIVEIRK